MTVYFVAKVGDTGKVKIGSTAHLNERLQAIAADYEFGIELLATCDGGQDVERAFHAILANDRVEGEWFAKSSVLDAIIEPLKNRVIGKRLWTRLRPLSGGQDEIETDRQIARDALLALMKRCSSLGMGNAQQTVFEQLHALNPLWSRRRVRAIWEMKATRIDHYEVRDLEALVGNRRAEWSETIAPELRRK